MSRLLTLLSLVLGLTCIPACGQWGEPDSDEEPTGNCDVETAPVDPEDTSFVLTPREFADRYGGERTATLTWWDDSSTSELTVTTVFDVDDSVVTLEGCGQAGGQLLMNASVDLITRDEQIDEFFEVTTFRVADNFAQTTVEASDGRYTISLLEDATHGELTVNGSTEATW